MPIPWIVTLSVVAFLLLVLTAASLVMKYPGKPRMDLTEYTSYKYAHRGLHNAQRAENSMSAFRAAADAGFAIELDIRFSRDGEVVVFHDDTLDRVVGISGKVIDYTAEELSRMSLAGSAEGIPTFREVLDAVDGRVPILIEVKETTVGGRGVVPAAARLLRDYRGPYLIQSFNPLTVLDARIHLPEVPRGFLGTHLTKKKFQLTHFITEHFLLNFKARPDFVAYELGERSFLPFRQFRAMNKKTTLFTWTVRSAEEEREAFAAGFDTVIFENYLPSEVRNEKR